MTNENEALISSLQIIHKDQVDSLFNSDTSQRTSTKSSPTILQNKKGFPISLCKDSITLITNPDKDIPKQKKTIGKYLVDNIENSQENT